MSNLWLPPEKPEELKVPAKQENPKRQEYKKPDWSPEPWTIEGEIVDLETRSTIVCKDGSDVISASTDGDDCYACYGVLDILPADAARIVACVNACKDIPTAALENGVIQKFMEATRWTGWAGKRVDAFGALSMLHHIKEAIEILEQAGWVHEELT